MGKGPQDALKRKVQVDAAMERVSSPRQGELMRAEGNMVGGVPFKRISLLDPIEHAETVRSATYERVKAAVEVGLPEEYANELQCLLTDYSHIFRVSLQADPPLTVPHLHIKIKEGATPKRMRPRPMYPVEKD